MYDDEIRKDRNHYASRGNATNIEEETANCTSNLALIGRERKSVSQHLVDHI